MGCGFHNWGSYYNVLNFRNNSFLSKPNGHSSKRNSNWSNWNLFDGKIQTELKKNHVHKIIIVKHNFMLCVLINLFSKGLSTPKVFFRGKQLSNGTLHFAAGLSVSECRARVSTDRTVDAMVSQSDNNKELLRQLVDN